MRRLAPLVLLLPVVFSASASASTSCGNAKTPKRSFVAGDITVTGGSCKTAKHVARAVLRKYDKSLEFCTADCGLPRRVVSGGRYYVCSYRTKQGAEDPYMRGRCHSLETIVRFGVGS